MCQMFRFAYVVSLILVYGIAIPHMSILQWIQWQIMIVKLLVLNVVVDFVGHTEKFQNSKGINQIVPSRIALAIQARLEYSAFLNI